MRIQNNWIVVLGISLLATFSVQSAMLNTLIDAASRGDINAVRDLLRDGAEVNDMQGDGMTALHWAAEIGNAQLADMLIYAGSNTEAGTRIGQYTPLHIASRNGQGQIVQKLVDAGANVHAKTTNSGTTALHLAAISGNDQSVVALI